MSTEAERVDGWWDEIEREIRGHVTRHGTMSARELARRLRMSESATSSVLRVLCLEGDVQTIVRVLRKRKGPRAAPAAIRRHHAA
jgi:ribosomal protein S25